MNKRHKYNHSIVNELAKKHNRSISAVMKALNGDRKSEVSEDIVRDYHKALKAINEITPVVLNNVLNN